MIAFDVETHPIAVGNQLPQIVCVSWATPSDMGIVHVRDAEPLMRRILTEDRIVNHNIAFDMGCVMRTWPHLAGDVIAAYQSNRVRCTLRWDQLHDIALGRETWDKNLAEVCKSWGIQPRPNKEHPWRTRFAELEPHPIAMWPKEAIEYSQIDAVAAMMLGITIPDIPDVAEQSRYDLWLKLSSAFGLLCDAPKVEQWGHDLEVKRAGCAAPLREAKFIVSAKKKGQPIEKRKMAPIYERLELAYAQAQLDLPRTPTGKPQSSAEICKDSGDPLLAIYAEWLGYNAAITRELPILRQGIVHTRYGLADTGRSISSSPNLQNMTVASGSRQCFRPRDGHVYAVCDFRMLELCCLGQLCVSMGCGDVLASVIRGGGDPHADFAADLLGVSYDGHNPEHKKARRDAKDGNFGFPGGAGPEAYQRSIKQRYGRSITLQFATYLRDKWRRKWPDVRAYQRFIGRWIDGACRTCGVIISGTHCAECGAEAEVGSLDHYRSGRKRGGMMYTQACNTLFQGLGADVTKATGWALTTAGYRIAAFVHDEYLIEVPIVGARDAAADIARIMGDVARDWLPHAPSSCTPTLATRWIKDDPRYDSTGQLEIIQCQ